MSGEVLKPCPICGKKVSIARTENEVGERWWFITRGTYKTTRCNCRLFLESEKFTCGWNDDYSLECRAKLIDRWNTRATGGTLTAEQVMAIAAKHQPDYCSDTHVCFDWQAIADELNANLGSETCYIVKTPSDSDFSDDWRYRCSECGCNIPVNERDPETGDVINAANYCPNCGKAVER